MIKKEKLSFFSSCWNIDIASKENSFKICWFYHRGPTQSVCVADCYFIFLYGHVSD